MLFPFILILAAVLSTLHSVRPACGQALQTFLLLGSGARSALFLTVRLSKVLVAPFPPCPSNLHDVCCFYSGASSLECGVLKPLYYMLFLSTTKKGETKTLYNLSTYLLFWCISV